MNRRSVFIALGALALVAGTAWPQARTWGFSKDTVYEWMPGGDTVQISNQGAALQFDSVALLLVRPDASPFEVYCKTLSNAYVFSNQSGLPASRPQANTLQIAGNQSLPLFGFLIDNRIAPIVAKRAVSAGDTVQGRLILRAAGGRGQDTLMIMGTWQGGYVSSLRSLKGRSTGRTAPGLFDLLGRAWRNPDKAGFDGFPLLPSGK